MKKKAYTLRREMNRNFVKLMVGLGVGDEVYL